MLTLFLGGSCGKSKWRDKLVKMLDKNVLYYNPVVKNWNKESQHNEDFHKSNDDVVLFVITPETDFTYSVYEMTVGAIVHPEKTIICFYDDIDDDVTFTKHDKLALNKIKQTFIERFGFIHIYTSLAAVAKEINSRAKEKPKLNIAIDGVAGCGKSTLASELSKALKVFHFNTGSIYRAIACDYLATFGDVVTPKKVKEYAKKLKIEFSIVKNVGVCKINGKNYEKALRDVKTSCFVPQISKYEEIRKKARKVQQYIAVNYDCVIEGRDIGREVLPDAQFKFFITADLDVRAERRYKQMSEKTTIEDVKKQLLERDGQDIRRKTGKLKPAEDAIIVDTSFMTIEESVKHCVEIIRKSKNM